MTNTHIVEKKEVTPFDELIISWNSQRPHKGHYLIQVSLLVESWSPWFDYAFWGVDSQHSFKYEDPAHSLSIFQDTIQVTNEKNAKGYKIKLIAKEGATLGGFRAFYPFTSNNHRLCTELKNYRSVQIEVEGLSQLKLPDERNRRLCSPTSTTAVLRHLMHSSELCPLDFAKKVHDRAFDIYGNWVLNAAQANHELNGKRECVVRRLANFGELHAILMQGSPVVVSVKGTLPGSFLPYESGHLLVVRGYDSSTQQVLCMDPAYPENETTHVAYPLADFLSTWQRRQGLAYLFTN